ncbi:MAG: ribbon-helix-helix protein, CopG family [Metallibacterium scheffleri]|jgi:hypothetical protein|uniref:ribbon-helix-helix protein, CopG family n=1 Tax=Metallibacterium scheffleri TaxID=993689 RepID=UPI0026EDFE52|nr:ribbon-helix-helix protein, CopG family [Metallibacterium scheffleri]MCK9366797.1 ribbon-helix-helix protein, CopG family [Metallibacterium scheffleri]
MTARITVRLSNAELGALRREAMATGQPQAEVVRRALTERALMAEIERAVLAKVTAGIEPVAQRLADLHDALVAHEQRLASIASRVDLGASRDDLIKATNFLSRHRNAGDEP